VSKFQLDIHIGALCAANVQLYSSTSEIKKRSDNIPTYFLLELGLPTGPRGHCIAPTQKILVHSSSPEHIQQNYTTKAVS
jgi:hypothetical protein